MFVHTHPTDHTIFLEMPHSGLQGIPYRGHKAIDGIPLLAARNTRFDSDAVRATIGKGCDAAVPEMTGYDALLAEFGLAGLRYTLPRAFVDVNRSKAEASGLALQDGPSDQHHNGVIWSRTMTTGLTADELGDSRRAAEIVRERSEPMLCQPYSREEFSELMAQAYDPYHAAIQAQHELSRAKRGNCIHLALHSIAPYAMNKADGTYVAGPRAKRGKLDLKASTMPDIILIHNGFRACLPEFVEAVEGAFTRLGYIVDYGKGPLLGDNGVTGMYGGRNGVHCIGIEHVTHFDEEPGRIDGDPRVDADKARRHQQAYRAAIKALLDL